MWDNHIMKNGKEKLLKLTGAIVLAVLVSFIAVCGPRAVIKTAAEETTEDTASSQDQALQQRTAIFYLLPSVFMAATLTVIVARQKRENRK